MSWLKLIIRIGPKLLDMPMFNMSHRAEATSIYKAPVGVVIMCDSSGASVSYKLFTEFHAKNTYYL
jgi:hypothetical protein